MFISDLVNIQSGSFGSGNNRVRSGWVVNKFSRVVIGSSHIGSDSYLVRSSRFGLEHDML